MSQYQREAKLSNFAAISNSFAYLTPKLRLDPNDLLSEEFPYFPTFIHCICSPDRATEIVKQIDEREKHWYNGIRPTIIWEPIPDSATVRTEM